MGVSVGVSLGTGVSVGVGEAVPLAVGEGVPVAADVDVGEPEAVAVADDPVVGEDVGVGVRVCVGVRERVGVRVSSRFLALKSHSCAMDDWWSWAHSLAFDRGTMGYIDAVGSEARDRVDHVIGALVNVLRLTR